MCVFHEAVRRLSCSFFRILNVFLIDWRLGNGKRRIRMDRRCAYMAMIDVVNLSFSYEGSFEEVLDRKSVV